MKLTNLTQQKQNINDLFRLIAPKVIIPSSTRY